MIHGTGRTTHPSIPEYARLPLAEFGADHRLRVLTALELAESQRVADVGYGARAESADIADLVGSSGDVLSVDLEDVVRGGGNEVDVSGLWASYRLPVPDHSLDRVHADRVLHHVDDSLRFFAELRRTLRPGGLACVTEPDWETLVIDPIHNEINYQFTRLVSTSIVRHATFGRQLPRLAQSCGFAVRTVLTVAPVLRDFPVADRILGLSHITERLVSTGRIRKVVAEQWLAAMEAGPFLATGIVFTTVLESRKTNH